MEKQKLSVKKGLAYTEAISYMKALVESLESGKIIVESGEEHITLTPTEHIDIKVEAKTKGNKQKFSFEMSWSAMAKTDLKISDMEPGTKKSPADPEKKEKKPAAKEVKKNKNGKKTQEKKEKK